MRRLWITLGPLSVLLMATNAFAQPKGLRDAEVGKKLWSFNVLVKPHGWVDTGNACNGARIFFDEEPNNGGVSDTITWVLDPNATQNFITPRFPQPPFTYDTPKESKVTSSLRPLLNCM